MPRILIAPSAYKGTLSPAQVSVAIAKGARRSGRQLDLTLLPLADGGDGTIESLNMAIGGEIHQVTVAGPLGHPALATWLKLPGKAVVELASSSGIALLAGKQLQPLSAHTFGLGEVLAACIEQGERHIVVAVGGSASTDGGTGALRALGATFLDSGGAELPLGGGSLTNLASCNLKALEQIADNISIQIATDVTNQLLGVTGAALIFAPQKGATSSQCLLLDSALSKLADILELQTGDIFRNRPGSGSGGGTAFGLACTLKAEIISGFHWLSSQINLSEEIGKADLVVSGEGHLDRQSAMGKGVGQLAKLCAEAKRPLWIVAARSQEDLDWVDFGIERVITVARPDEIIGSEQIAEATEAAFNSL